jgi:hypothetical protein
VDRLRHGIETYCPKAGGNMSRLCIATALILTTMGPMSAYAQTQPTLSILIEDMDADARKCGVDMQTLRAPAVLTLRNNRIRVSDTRTYPFLYINAVFLPVNNGASCVNSISVSIEDVDKAIVRNGFKADKPESAILCSARGAGISQLHNTTKQVFELVERYVKRCLANVDY